MLLVAASYAAAYADYCLRCHAADAACFAAMLDAAALLRCYFQRRRLMMLPPLLLMLMLRLILLYACCRCFRRATPCRFFAPCLELQHAIFDMPLFYAYLDYII